MHGNKIYEKKEKNKRKISINKNFLILFYLLILNYNASFFFPWYVSFFWRQKGYTFYQTSEKF